MKNLVWLGLLLGTVNLAAQNWVNVASDKQGDDFSFNPDAQSLLFRYSVAQDSIYLRLNHYRMRPASFGYAIALDTNLNPQDGAPIPQHSLFNSSPNLSMNYDLILYVYQNSFFPGLNVETYDGQNNIWSVNLAIDTTDLNAIVLGIPLAQIGNATEFNVLACTGSFDISPGGAGPTDVMPDNSYGQIRKQSVNLHETMKRASTYPVPAEDFFYLDYSGSIYILDIQGSKIAEMEAVPNEAIPCAVLPPAVYIITTDEGQPLTKLLKQ